MVVVLANFSNYVALVCQCFQDDETLNALCDGQIISGFRRALADDDMLIEISVTSKTDNDTKIAAIVNEIMRIMKRPLTKTIGGISYSVSTDGRINFVPVNDPAFLDRVEVTGTCRLRYLDS
jgi:hypothetical protein